MQMFCVDGIKYTIDNGLAVVCGFNENICENIEIPSFIDTSIRVVGIADKAFYKCQYIMSISLPRSIKFIGANAFAWCNSLKRIFMPTVRNIGDRAFMGCGRLSEIKFGPLLECVGDKAFAYCTSLVAIRFPDSMKYMGESIFEGCRHIRYVYIPSSVDEIKNGTFYACSSLCEVEVTDTIRYIDEYSFAYCTSIALPNFPAKTIINNNAFYGCDAIKVNCIA